MIKSLVKLLLILCAVVVVVLGYRTQGYVDIRWQGVSVYMKMGTFFLLMIVCVWVLFYVFSFIKYLEKITQNIRSYWKLRYQREGQKYMEEAVSAFLGGMPDIALKKSWKASEILKDSMLSKWIYAFIAKEMGAVVDDKAVKSLIESKYLGLAGYRLRIEYLMNQRDRLALTELESALSQYPGSIWILKSLFKLYIQDNNLEKALEIAKKIRHLDKTDPNSNLVLCYLLCSRHEADNYKKLKYLEWAFDLDKNNLVVAADFATVYLREKKIHKAQNVIETVWKYCRNSILGDLYLDSLKGMNSDQTISYALRLLDISNSSLESYIVVIKACIACEFYSKARYYLEKAIEANAGMSYKLFELRVTLTKKDNAEKLDYFNWIKHVEHTKSFEGWECAVCHTQLKEWAPECTRCGHVNSYFWYGEHELSNSFFAIKNI